MKIYKTTQTDIQHLEIVLNHQQREGFETDQILTINSDSSTPILLVIGRRLTSNQEAVDIILKEQEHGK